MKISSIVLFALYASASVAAQQTPSICERIQQLDGRISTQQAQIVRLLRVYSEAHPEVMAQRKSLANLEASRTADINQAKSQGLACFPAKESKVPETSREKTQ